MPNRLVDVALLALMLLFFILSPSVVVVAAPPPPASDDAAALAGHGAWVREQNQVNGSSCCSEADGRPLADNEFRRRDGHWEVLYSRAHWPDAAPGGSWLVVPPDAVLPQTSPILLPVAWVNHGKVLCLALAGAT